MATNKRTKHTDEHRTPRTVTITQNGREFMVENDFRSEEVSDIILHIAMGMRAVALSVEEQTGMPAETILNVIYHMAAREESTVKHSLLHKDDDAETTNE